MTLKKKLIMLCVLVLTLTLCCFGLVACGDEESTDWEKVYIYEVNGEKATITGLTAYGITITELTIPEKLSGRTIIRIGEDAFRKCKSLTSIVLSSNVTSIGNYAFYGSALTSITIGSGVTSIGSSAFEDCYKLVEVINKSSLPITKGYSSNGYVGYYALRIKTSGESAIVNQNNYIFYTASSKNYLLGYAGKETALILPDNYNGENYEIYKYAFHKRYTLTSVVIPDSVTSIGYDAFYGCDSLTSVTFNNANGWYVSERSTATSGTDVTVTDATQNATYLTDTYDDYYWKRK